MPAEIEIKTQNKQFYKIKVRLIVDFSAKTLWKPEENEMKYQNKIELRIIYPEKNIN